MASEKELPEKVFISYNRHDFEHAKYLCNLLEGAGISCWMAPRNIEPSNSWASEIIKGLTECKVLALLISRTSMNSIEVAKEVDLANTAGIKIVPIRLEDIQTSGDIKYHLAGRQWVDAITGKTRARFEAAVKSILVQLDKSTDSAVSNGGTLLGQARDRVLNLEQRFSAKLEKTSAVISARGNDADSISVFFPQRIGSTGLDLIAEFDCIKRTMRIYANANSDGDKFKEPFLKFIERKFDKTFPKLSGKSSARKYEFVTLMQETYLTTPELNESAQDCFPRFLSHVDMLAKTIISGLLDWAMYAQELDAAISKIEVGLVSIFQNGDPEGEKWRIGAPEGRRLNGFLSGGRIDVYKETWQPQSDNCRGRGLLSFSLESEGNFLHGLKFGISKYEKWLNLGGAFEEQFKQVGKACLGDALKATSSQWYVFEANLDRWSDPGLHFGEPKWRGDSLDEFVAEILGLFTKLKSAVDYVDAACIAIPSLQDIDPAILPSINANWTDSGLYIRNRFRVLVDRVQARNSGKAVCVSFRMRPSSDPKFEGMEILLSVKLGKFDAAITLLFRLMDIITYVVSIEPRDLELTRGFLKLRHPELLFTGKPQNKGICQGLTLAQWMDQYQELVEGRIDDYLTAMDDLASYLKQRQVLCIFVATELHTVLTDGDGWIVRNHAEASLERGDGIYIYRKTWLLGGQQDDNQPALQIQIMPNAACFNDLWLTVSLRGQQISAFDQAIGRVIGAFDFAFGASDKTGIKLPGNPIWAQRLQELPNRSQANHFDSVPLSDAETNDLRDVFHTMGRTFKKLDPILSDLSKKINDHQFNQDLDLFAEQMTAAIGVHFPPTEKWVIQNNVRKQNPGNISLFKSSWCRVGDEFGRLSIRIQSELGTFDNLDFGVYSCRPEEFTKDQAMQLKEKFDLAIRKGKGGGQAWPWYAIPANRLTGCNTRTLLVGEKRKEFFDYYAIQLQQIKAAASLIDELLSGNSDRANFTDVIEKSLSVTSTQ